MLKVNEKVFPDIVSSSSDSSPYSFDGEVLLVTQQKEEPLSADVDPTLEVQWFGLLNMTSYGEKKIVACIRPVAGRKKKL